MKYILTLALFIPTLAQAQDNPYYNNYVPQPPPINYDYNVGQQLQVIPQFTAPPQWQTQSPMGPLYDNSQD